MNTGISADKIGSGGIFESMRSYGREIFRLNEHINRLFESAKSLNIDIGYSKAEISDMVAAAFKEREIQDAYIRLSVSRGLSGKASVDILINKCRIYPASLYREGVKAVTAVPEREAGSRVVSRTKSSDFLYGVLAKIEARDLAVFETIVLTEYGMLAEGTVSNIFIVKKKKVFTPPAHIGILKGVTRGVVFELAGGAGIDICERPLTRHDLYNCDEAFLTNTSVGIIPLTEANFRAIGGGRPGPVTKRLIEYFGRLTMS